MKGILLLHCYFEITYVAFFSLVNISIFHYIVLKFVDSFNLIFFFILNVRNKFLNKCLNELQYAP